MRRILPAVFLFALVLAACGDSVEPTITTIPGTSSTTGPPDTSTTSTASTLPPSATFTLPPESTTSSTTTSSSTTSTTLGAAEEFTVTYFDGDVTGDTDIEVDTDTLIVVIVSSDVDDEVHIHGYDLRADVGADRVAIFEFVTDIPGTFEIELEDEGTPLAELVVGS